MFLSPYSSFQISNCFHFYFSSCFHEGVFMRWSTFAKVPAHVSKILQEASRRVGTTIQEVSLLGHKIWPCPNSVPGESSPGFVSTHLWPVTAPSNALGVIDVQRAAHRVQLLCQLQDLHRHRDRLICFLFWKPCSESWSVLFPSLWVTANKPELAPEKRFVKEGWEIQGESFSRVSSHFHMSTYRRLPCPSGTFN